MRSSFGTKAESAFRVVVLPVPVPPEMRTLSLPRTQAAMNWAERAVGVPGDQVVDAVKSRENFRIDRRASERERE
jgi:hypothetical protein